MVDPDRRPTAQEIEELIDLVRRDPASPAFIDLGEAYLALGRPRDAIQVGSMGLEASPDNLEGRVMLARAFAALHQWKEAQGELLRVVKVDRSSRQGFALLGEVLLRRSDFERAVPVLQHAQNLDPTSPQILAMLRRARAGQQLDPPNPIPTPVPPRGETDAPVEIQRSRAQPAQPPPNKRPPVPGASTTPTLPQYGGLDSLTEPDPAPPPMAAMQPMATMQPMSSAPPPQPPMPRTPKQTAPPPMSVEGVKPRIIASQKVQNAAAASLRQSAAVGETYLNDLLTGGLLDVAGVRVPDEEYDLRPDRRWGRSTRRAFIFLFVVLVLGIGGGGTWYWWTEKQKHEAVARLQKEAKVAVGDGEYSGLADSLGKLTLALEKDKSNKQTFAYYVETGGLGVLLYGEVRVPSREDPSKEILIGPDQVDAAYKSITQGEDTLGPEDEGNREKVIGKVAYELATLPNDLSKPEMVIAANQKLTDTNKLLDDYLASNKTDRWAQWLKGRALLAAGSRKAAATMLKGAAEGTGTEGLVPAMIDYANLLADDGKTTEAMTYFKSALDRTKGNHQLAILGQAIAKSEASIDVNETIGDLNAKFVESKISTRVAAYRWLALAIANLAIEEYPTAIEAIGKATLNKPPAEPRFWSRVAWVHYKLGRPAEDKRRADLDEADKAFGKCLYYNKSPEPDPTMQLVKAGLYGLARGLPDKVLDDAPKNDGVRPVLLRTYALLDLGKPKEAFEEVSKILTNVAGSTGKPCEEGNDQANIEAKILCEQARMLSNDKERTAAADALLSLARQAKSKLGRHALGVAYLAINDLVNAKEHLGQAVKEISDTSPNPFEYRSRTALAEIALRENDLEGANKSVQEALNINQGYFPTKALLARILVRNKETDKAMSVLAPLLSEAAANTPMVQLTLAEVLVVKKDSTAKDKENAENILTQVKGKPGVSDEEIGRIAQMIDPKLPDKLGVPAPAEVKPGDKPAEKPAPKPPRRRGR